MSLTVHPQDALSPGDPNRPIAAAPTTRRVYVALAAALAALLAIRLPQVIGELERSMPDELRRQVGDPSLVRLSISVGALLGVVVTLLALGVFWLVARALERHLFDDSIGRGRWRVGLFTLAVSACFLSSILAPALLGRAALPTPATQVTALVAGVLAVAAFTSPLRRLGPRRAAVVAVSVVGLAWLTSLASLAI